MKSAIFAFIVLAVFCAAYAFTGRDLPAQGEQTIEPVQMPQLICPIANQCEFLRADK